MHDLQQSVIRILNGQGQTLGAGFVLSEHLAVTCAHVVNAVGSAAGQEIHIQFFANDYRQTASVLHAGWSPQTGDDLAFLQLENLPQGIVPVTLGSAEKCNEHSYLSFGFAKIAGYDNRWASGIIDGVVFIPDKHKQPMVQLKGNEIRGGMSGAPVLDTRTDRVIGMVSEYGYDYDADYDYARRIAWATTADTLLRLASDQLLAEHPTLRLWPAMYGPLELQTYLQHLISSNEKLFLPDGHEVLLERIYVSLRADEMNAAERQAEHEMYLKDVEVIKKLAPSVGEDHYAQTDAVHKAFIRRPRMSMFQARNRPRRFGEREYRLLSLAEVEKRHRYAVILGDPGSGKTTLGKWLVLQFARALLEGQTFVHVQADLVQPWARSDKPIDLGPSRLPLLIRIADYARARWDREHIDNHMSLENFISLHWNTNDLPVELQPEAVHAMVKDYLLQGRALVVLDGLDEVSNPSQRRAVMQTVKRFIQGQPPTPKNNEWAGNRLLLTSRIIGYQFDPLTDLPHYTVEDMDEIAIGAFCRAWMTHVASIKEADEQGVKLKNAIFDHSHPGVRALAGNPLLLTILAQVYWSSASRSLPTRRVSLFDAAVEALYNQRKDRWENANISLRRLIQALGAVAAHIHAFERTGFAESGTVRARLREVLSDWDQVETVLQAARDVSGFLVERGEGAYGFLHRAVQEYFAACHLAHDPAQVSSRLAERLLEPTWREPITLAVGIVSHPRYPDSLHCLAEAFNTLLYTADPAGDFLPRRELLAVAACVECERLPSQIPIGRHIAQRLLILYANREGGRRSPVLRKRILDAFITLHQNGTRIQAEGALCDALLSPDFELRYAAIDVIIEAKWDSVTVAQVLVKAWLQYADPAVSLQTAIDEMFKRTPSCFLDEFLPLRQIIKTNPLIWEKASINLQWKSIFRLLYLPFGAYFKPDRINRDSPLTQLLVELLQTPNPFHPSVFEELSHKLIPLASQPGSALARDAALILGVLGNGSWTSTCIKNTDSQRRHIHPIAACLILALSLVELTSDNNQNRNQILANDLDHALRLANDVTRLWDESSARTQFLQKIRARLQLVVPLAIEGLLHINAHVADFMRDSSLAATYTYTLAIAFQEGLDCALEQIKQHTYFSSIAFDSEFNTQITRIRKLHHILEDMDNVNRGISGKVIKNNAHKNRINGMKFQVNSKCAVANEMALELGYFLPLDIRQTRLQTTSFIRRQAEKIQPQKLHQMLADTRKLNQALTNGDKVEGKEVKELTRALADLLGPTFPFDRQELRDLISAFYRLMNKSAKNKVVAQSLQAMVLSIDLTDPSHYQLVKAFQQNLAQLSSFIENYTDVVERNRDNSDDVLTAKADTYAQKVAFLLPEVCATADALNVSLPIDWEKAYNLLLGMEQSFTGPQNTQNTQLADELLVTLDAMLDLRQQHTRELVSSHTAADYMLETQGQERAKLLEDQLDQANKHAHILISTLDPGLAALDINRGLEQVKKRERSLFQNRVHAQNRIRELEIEYARTLTRAMDQWAEFELALSQEHSEKRSSGKLKLGNDFSHAQEIIQLRTQIRELTDRLTYLHGLVQEKASDFALSLKVAEEHARQSLQLFERALRSEIELSSTIDLASMRRLDLAFDLDFALGLARPIANVSELMRSMREWQTNNVVTDVETRKHFESAFNAAKNLQKSLTASTPIAHVMDMLVVAYMDRWPRDVRGLDNPPPLTQLRADTITDLISDLSSSNDERRERAKKSLVAKHHASELGSAAIEQIARLTEHYFQEPQIATQLSWALESIIHDQPSLLVTWIEKMADVSNTDEVQIILESMHNVTAKVFETILDTLQSSPVLQVNKSLLASLSWLVRLKRIPRGRLPILREALFVWLAKEEDADLRSHIIEVLGHWQEDSDSVGLKLFGLLNTRTRRSDLPALYMALARLAARRPNIAPKVHKKLREASFDIDAAAALIRLQVAKDRGDDNTLKQREIDAMLNTWSRTSSDGTYCLQAILKAGVDDDIWDPAYHDILVNAMRAQLELQINQSADSSVLTDLLAQFEDALQGRNWPLRRFILAVVAACTEAMPVAVQHAYNGNLEALLVKATTDAESFNSRRFALTALSYLRTVTPAIIPALLAGCHDAEDVQQDTLIAASHFQSVDGDLLPLLMEQISGESVARAYTVAHLLNALGSSAASETSDLGNQIIEAVVEALKNEGSQREVVVSGEPKGKLEDALYTTLLRVAGWMG